MVEYSEQQVHALETARNWFRSGNSQVLRIFGYAGTGKTFTARGFASEIRGRTHYMAYTGKAAMVMQSAGCRGAMTIHSSIYMPETDESSGECEFTLLQEPAFDDADLIVIDECSMVGEEVADDILSFGKPVLVLGDPAQLPPVDGGGYFTEHEPDVMLSEIHRQAEGNPIIHLATKVRQKERLEEGEYGDSVVCQRTEIRSNTLSNYDQVLVGRNATRTAKNRIMRNNEGYESLLPVEGERLICTKNDSKKGIFNGGIFTVHRQKTLTDSMGRNLVKLRLKGEDLANRSFVDVYVHENVFRMDPKDFAEWRKSNWRALLSTQFFDFGYALTVHKSQGSQWDNVLLYDESRIFGEDWHRWAYTGITRAAERITIAK